MSFLGDFFRFDPFLVDVTFRFAIGFFLNSVFDFLSLFVNHIVYFPRDFQFFHKINIFTSEVVLRNKQNEVGQLQFENTLQVEAKLELKMVQNCASNVQKNILGTIFQPRF